MKSRSGAPCPGSRWPIVWEAGLRPIGQVAIDGVWSALRFRPLAPGEVPFTGR